MGVVSYQTKEEISQSFVLRDRLGRLHNDVFGEGISNNRLVSKIQYAVATVTANSLQLGHNICQTVDTETQQLLGGLSRYS